MTDYPSTYDEDDERNGLTISAFYDDLTDAEEAVSALAEAGIARSQIVMTKGSDRAVGATSAQPEQRGFFEMLADLFFPYDDRSAYAEGLRRGGHMVTAVNLSDAQYETAMEILDDEGAVDLDERAQSWRSDGWVSHRERRSGGLIDDPLSQPYEHQMRGAAVGAAGLASPGAISTPVRKTEEQIEGELIEQEPLPRDSADAMRRGAGLSAADALDKDEVETRDYRRDDKRSRPKVRTYVRDEPDWP